MWNIGPERVINQLLQRGAVLSWVSHKAQGPDGVESLKAAWTNLLGPGREHTEHWEGDPRVQEIGSELRIKMDPWVLFSKRKLRARQHSGIVTCGTALVGIRLPESDLRRTMAGSLEPEEDTAEQTLSVARRWLGWG